MALATSAPDSLWAPLAHRNFRLLWVGFVTSQAGDIIQMLAQAWLVVELTGSAARLGLLAAAQALPRLLLGLFAGVLVDRVDRRRLLLATQSLAALQAYSSRSSSRTASPTPRCSPSPSRSACSTRSTSPPGRRSCRRSCRGR